MKNGVFPKGTRYHPLKLGTRGSALALAQSEGVATALQKKYPEIAVQIVPIQTSGDRFKGTSLAAAGGKGLFVKEIEEALLKGKIDLAVHSLKDLPGFLPEDLMLASFPKREDPRDCFVSNRFASFEELPTGSIIGTGSPRRQAQILALRPDCVVQPIRGNVDTRLKKLETENFDAIILAVAGLKRLQRENAVTQFFDPDFLIPAVGQGILGIEVRRQDKKLAKMLQSLEDPLTSLAARAERAFLQACGGDCYTPLAGFARIEKETIHMIAGLGTPDGRKFVRLEQSGTIHQPENLGEKLAKDILNALSFNKTV